MKRKIMGCVTSLLLAAASLTFAADKAVDVTGTWTMSVETQMGTRTPTMVLQQKGEQITGTYKGQMGESPVAGTVKGKDLALNVKLSIQGQEMTLAYIGTVEGNTMSGKVNMGQMGEGKFTGKKQ